MVKNMRMNKILVLLTILCLTLMSGTALGSPEPVNYVALGDSLAAGMTPEGDFDSSYADYLAQKIDGDQGLEDYDNFGVPGMTSTDLLNFLTSNFTALHTRLVYVNSIDPALLYAMVQKLSGVTDEAQLTILVNNLLGPAFADYLLVLQAGIMMEISNAEIITLDIGGDDVREAVEYGIPIPDVGENLSAILEIINDLIPEEAKIYVMGYPYSGPIIDAYVDPLNEAIETAIGEFDPSNETVIFVGTEDAFTKHYEKYLPQESLEQYNFHPAKQGYQALAKEFWQSVRNK